MHPDSRRTNSSCGLSAEALVHFFIASPPAYPTTVTCGTPAMAHLSFPCKLVPWHSLIHRTHPAASPLPGALGVRQCPVSMDWSHISSLEPPLENHLNHLPRHKYAEVLKGHPCTPPCTVYFRSSFVASQTTVPRVQGEGEITRPWASPVRAAKT